MYISLTSRMQECLACVWIVSLFPSQSDLVKELFYDTLHAEEIAFSVHTQIEEVIEKNGGAHLESYSLFDLYEGAQIKPGFKSVAYSITFRAKDRTLEESDISKAMDKILAGLEAMGIELRK